MRWNGPKMINWYLFESANLDFKVESEITEKMADTTLRLKNWGINYLVNVDTYNRSGLKGAFFTQPIHMYWMVFHWRSFWLGLFEICCHSPLMGNVFKN